MTDYLVDNSVWSRYAAGQVEAVERMWLIERTPSDLFVTCPPQILEFCHSARTPLEYRQQRELIELGFPLENTPDETLLLDLQEELWRSGKVHAAGALDVLIAGYAIVNGATILTADRDFLQIAAVSELQVEYIAPST